MIALIVIAGLVALFLIILCIPVQLALEADLAAERRFKVGLVWLFGLVRLSLKGRGHRPARARRAAVKAKVSAVEQWRRFKAVIKIIRTKGLWRQILRLITGVLKTIKFRDAVIDLRLGLGDPADTGMLFAVVGPLTPLIGRYAPFPLTLQPLMTDAPGIAGYSRGRISIQPIRLAGPVLGFIFSRPALRLIRVMVTQRWKKRR